ncbi:MULTISPECIES: hypothetical protein [Acinetobacter]|uniref:hypothetical protein n=1 Tax=Acinetobacter TaxID=469 RepID=UPI00028822C1|nr:MULTISPECIES: hypothetical protein [Acinetobacter]UUM28782.1 hypothetical protein NQU59_06730 [Acinetobacter colistiniresistens]
MAAHRADDKTDEMTEISSVCTIQSADSLNTIKKCIFPLGKSAAKGAKSSFVFVIFGIYYE